MLISRAMEKGMTTCHCRNVLTVVHLGIVEHVGRTASITHTIHVWYIYLHLVNFHGKCRDIYHTGKFGLIETTTRNSFV